MMKRKLRYFIGMLVIVFLGFGLLGCSGAGADSRIAGQKNNLFIIDPSGLAGAHLNESAEVVRDPDARSDKRYRFLILSETDVEGLDATAVVMIREKVLDGMRVIYPQNDAEKAGAFASRFYGSISPAGGKLLGVALKCELNFATQSYAVSVIPAFSNAGGSAADYIESVVSGEIASDENRARSEFLGVYMSRYKLVGGNFSEVSPYCPDTVYDRFDAFRNGADKKFRALFREETQTLDYFITYRKESAKFAYFKPCLVLRDFNGAVTATPILDSVYVYQTSGVSLTQEISVSSWLRGAPDEVLKITFEFA